jgi:hypothetical protein
VILRHSFAQKLHLPVIHSSRFPGEPDWRGEPARLGSRKISGSTRAMSGLERSDRDKIEAIIPGRGGEWFMAKY